jgi:uracil-DNA glycosylase family 4
LKNDPLSIWNQCVSSCTKCPLSTLTNRRITYRYSHGPYNYLNKVDILFVGEGPGESEYLLGKPFVGASGHELNDILEEAVPIDIRYLITNAIMCTPFLDSSLSHIGTPAAKEIDSCRSHLKKLIEITKPKAVIALGAIASRSLKKLVPCFRTIPHPSHILRSNHPDLERQRCILAIKAVIASLPGIREC